MKPILCCAFFGVLFGAHAQTITPTPTTASRPGGAVPLSLHVVARDQHTKTVEWVGVRTNGGQLAFKTNSYRVLAPYLNALDTATGQWVENKPVVEDYPGGIVCRGGWFTVILNHNLNSYGSVDMLWIDKTSTNRVTSHPLALYLVGPDGRSVLLARVKDCTAQISGDRVDYPDALEGNGIQGNISYQYGAGKFSQSLTITRWNPAVTPGAYGLDNARLELATELVEAPAAAIKLRTLHGGLADEQLRPARSPGSPRR